jgi:hypothetical protein
LLDTCLDCFDTLIGAQECLRICDNLDAVPNIQDVNIGPYYLGDDTGSRLQQCLDSERGGQRSVRLPPLVRDTTGDGIPDVGGPDDEPIPPDFFTMQYRVDDMTSLTECCTMNDFVDVNCTSVMLEAQTCMAGQCIDQCLSTTTTAYFECVRTNAASGECQAAGDCISELILPDDDENSSTTPLSLTLDLDVVLDGYNKLLEMTPATTENATDNSDSSSCSL